MSLGAFWFWVASRLYCAEMFLLQGCLRSSQSDLPQILVDALVVAEDRRFYRHKGVDWQGMCRAVLRSLQGQLQGASTVEQQLVRTVTGDYRRSLRRKFKEVLLARSLCTLANKREIAGCYLEVAYFGWQMRGFRQVCRRLGLKKALDIESAAEIVARLKYPQAQAPNLTQLGKITRRKSWIVKILREKKGHEGYVAGCNLLKGARPFRKIDLTPD